MVRAASFVTKVTGPVGTVHSCAICGRYKVLVKRFPPGRNPMGRGYGMSEGNKARGLVIQHIKATHPEKLV